MEKNALKQPRMKWEWGATTGKLLLHINANYSTSQDQPMPNPNFIHNL